MTKYMPSAVTAKEGINYVRTAIEEQGSLFIKIDQENDLGIDAIIEFTENLSPLNLQAAAQIKSGNSYYDKIKKTCHFAIGKHQKYWRFHPLPVIGIVYIPEFKQAYWTDIKRHLATDENASSIRFPISWDKRIDPINIRKFLIPHISGALPIVDLSEAIKLTKSGLIETQTLGLKTLFSEFINEEAAWDIFTAQLSKPSSNIHPIVIYWLAHIPWHGDIFYTGTPINSNTREYARALIKKFSIVEIENLLNHIDFDGIGRGSIAQSVIAVLSCITDISKQLANIIRYQNHSIITREQAVLCLAVLDKPIFLESAPYLINEGSEIASLLIIEINTNGFIDLFR